MSRPGHKPDVANVRFPVARGAIADTRREPENDANDPGADIGAEAPRRDVSHSAKQRFRLIIEFEPRGGCIPGLLSPTEGNPAQYR